LSRREQRGGRGAAPGNDRRGATSAARPPAAARRAPRPRDPEGRREAIVNAAVAVIAEHGIGDATHRRIAARADVPLGSTTYYFPSRAELVAAALERSGEDWTRECERLGAALAEEASPEALQALVTSYLADRARAIVEYELYVAAAREERLRPLAQAWLEQLHERLEPVAGPIRARAIAMLLDGAMVQAVALARPLDAEAVEAGLAALLGDS
jgi:DNA-binding transcriptional regulator YbjK